MLTAEQYAILPSDGRLTELLKGEVIELPSPTPTHGYYCANAGGILREYVEARQLGRVVSNNCGVVTSRNPDTVRGPDVAYYSFAKVPKGPLPDGYWPAPELAIEVLSPGESRIVMNCKVVDYMIAEVQLTCVLDPEAGLIAVYPQDELPRRHTLDEELTLPEVFADFAVPVRRFFE